MRTRVKFCGIRTVADAQAAAALGVDAIGLVFYAPSARVVALETALEISTALPPFVARVALFLDPTAQAVTHVVERLRPDLLQFHGNERREFCETFGLPYIKSVGRDAHARLDALAQAHPRACALLLDSNLGGAPGGSGKTFDWSMLTRVGRPLILAGGLNADNVALAIREVRPYAVDVSSGIERARGSKSVGLMEEFMREVNRADSEIEHAPA